MENGHEVMLGITNLLIFLLSTDNKTYRLNLFKITIRGPLQCTIGLAIDSAVLVVPERYMVVNDIYLVIDVKTQILCKLFLTEDTEVS